MTHFAFTPGSVAVLTGGASGIGLAAAKRFAQRGLADLGAERLARAAQEVAVLATNGTADVMALETDVSRLEDLRRLEAAVQDRFGGTDVLVNNAGIQPGSRLFGPVANWERVLDVNLWGVIRGTQTLSPQ
jgi:NAD(P)-dependent dehydrogenase (short-subunit alcohol dehydrogenase family)